MTVAELIEELRKLPQDLDVYVGTENAIPNEGYLGTEITVDCDLAREKVYLIS